eukprot:1994865-Rhodomonas_salina.1
MCLQQIRLTCSVLRKELRASTQRCTHECWCSTGGSSVVLRRVSMCGRYQEQYLKEVWPVVTSELDKYCMCCTPCLLPPSSLPSSSFLLPPQPSSP